MKTAPIRTFRFLTTAAALLALAAGLITLTAPPTARACGFCLNLSNAFTLAHPKSIDIALATRSAIEKGVLKANQPVPSRAAFGGGNGFISPRKLSAATLADSWLARLRFPDSAGPVTVHILLIDSRESCGFDIRRGSVLPQTAPSERSDAAIITTKETLHALASGSLDLAGAQKMGLVAVEGNFRLSAADGESTVTPAQPDTPGTETRP